MLLSCNFESILIDLIDCLNRGCQFTVFKSLCQCQMLRNRSKPDRVISILGIFLLNKTINRIRDLQIQRFFLNRLHRDSVSLFRFMQKPRYREPATGSFSRILWHQIKELNVPDGH